MCDVLDVSRSGYYKWLKNRDSERKQARKALVGRIQQIFNENRKAYGSPRIHQVLRREGNPVNLKVVEKLMREHKITPVRRRKFKITTDSKHDYPVAENKLQRDFTAAKPNDVWVTDITYIDTKQGWLYLAVFIDLYSRKVVGASMSERMTAKLVVDAFEMGVARRGGIWPKIVHSDRGSQYASDVFRALLDHPDCVQSMSRKGDCWDNAVAESFFKTLKAELVYRETYETREQAQLSIFEYIEIFYNRNRLNSVIGYLTPEEKELKDKKVA